MFYTEQFNTLTSENVTNDVDIIIGDEEHNNFRGEVKNSRTW